MAIKHVLSYEAKQPYYIRFTCEKCGCRTHWIKGEIISTEASEHKGQYDRTKADQNAVAALDRSMNETIDRLKKELDECFKGKRMLAGDISTFTGGVINYFGDMKCPKCQEIQSWAPRLAKGFTLRKQQKNADDFNSTPVLSRPEVVFGGEMPAPDAPDFAAPCRLEIHGTSFGVPHASPVYLNGVQVGETNKNSIDISVDTYYKDNLIMIYQNTWTSYVEAEEGRTLNLEYRNFMVHRV